MGQRFRLKGDFDESGFSPHVQVILRALKRYGLILADNGSSWYISGVPDERWDNEALVSELRLVKGSDFEAVDVSSLMKDENSGEAVQVAYLTLARSGDGKGALAAQGLSCKRDGTCTGVYNTGEEVTITASPRACSVLAEWNGCAFTDGNACTVVMDGDTYVTATFLKKPKIRVTPRSINFGTIATGITSSPRTLSIRNTGSAPLTINSLEITGTDAPDFQHLGGCSTPLVSEASCAITLTATLVSSGARAAEVIIRSNDSKMPSLRVKLRAKAR
jgi:hypothetical protein